MVIYQTIWNFLMTYVFYFDVLDGAFYADYWDYLFNFQAGTDGRLIWAPLFSAAGFWPWLVSHLLTTLACISLCVMLWKLITLPIKWAIKRAE